VIVTERHPSRYAAEKAPSDCPKCGSRLRRLERKGFLQIKVYPKFGYYPWECPVCRETSFLKKRYNLKRRRTEESPSTSS
jgi:predicted nucleic-acid-binding Zn-ribbon protein